MIEGNKIKQTELLLTKKSQRFADFVFLLRKQRKERFLSYSLGRTQNGMNISQIRKAGQITSSVNLEELSRHKRIGYSNPHVSKCETRLYQKNLGDSALRYKYRISVGNRSFYHQYQLPSHCFLPTQQQLDKHLKQSRLISEQSRIASKPLNGFQRRIQGQQQIMDGNDSQFIKGYSGQRIWGIKTAKYRREQQKQEEQSQQETNEQSQNRRNSFLNDRQIKSQYFEAKKTYLKGRQFNDVSIQRREFPIKHSQKYNNGQESSRSFIYGFDQMPSISQNPELLQKKTERKRQPGKFYKKIPENEKLNDLMQEQPLLAKW